MRCIGRTTGTSTRKYDSASRSIGIVRIRVPVPVETLSASSVSAQSNRGIKTTVGALEENFLLPQAMRSSQKQAGRQMVSWHVNLAKGTKVVCSRALGRIQRVHGGEADSDVEDDMME